MPVSAPGTPSAPPGTQVSALDLITGALRLINCAPGGATPDDDVAQDGISALNQMVDSWNADKRTIYTINRVVVVPASLKQAYTLGSGADFDTPRPARIENITVLNLANPSQPLELYLEMLTDEDWAAIPVKNVSSPLPRKAWDDGGFPFRTLSFFPIPSAQVNFVIYGWNPLTIFPDLSSAYTFPPGYIEALRYNLAINLAPEFGREPSPTVVQRAMRSLAIIKSNNVQLVTLTCDPALNRGTGHYNWLTDNQ